MVICYLASQQLAGQDIIIIIASIIKLCIGGGRAEENEERRSQVTARDPTVVSDPRLYPYFGVPFLLLKCSDTNTILYRDCPANLQGAAAVVECLK